MGHRLQSASWMLLGALALAMPAAAAKAKKPEPPPEPEVPAGELPEIKLERIPPRFSYDFSLAFGFHQMTYWYADVAGWMGIGLRGAWGKNFGEHRVGFQLAAMTEGPVPVHMTAAFEPGIAWDWVHGSGFSLGAVAGPAILLHHTSRTVNEQTRAGLAPAVSARLGWSQTWSRVGRRLFIMLEPKARLMQVVEGDRHPWKPNPSVALVVGSGRGY